MITRRQLLAAFPLTSHAATKAALPKGKPLVAFHYQASFSPQALHWYTSFQHLVTGAILDDKTSDSLRVNNTKLIAYEWSSGFYTGDAVSAPLDWQAQVTAKRKDWLLTPRPLTGAAAEGGRVAEWYNFANSELRKARAQFLAGRLRKAGYDGYFFDTVGIEQIPEPAKRAFAAQHPGLDYNVGQGEFFKELRKAMPGKIIFLNQGFRHADALLPHADFDLSESYFTHIEGQAGTALREWDSSDKPWEAIKTPMAQLVLPAAKKYPHVRFVHVNYASAGAVLTEKAAQHSFVGAKLYGHDSYLIVPSSPESEESPVYGYDLGRPMGQIVEEAGIVGREYERAVVGYRFGVGKLQLAGAAVPASMGSFIVHKG